MEKNKFIKGYLGGILTALVVILCLISIKENFYSGTSVNAVTEENVDKKESLLDNKNISEKVRVIEAIVDNYFLEEADKKRMIEGIYAGMMKGLKDPYSVYYTIDEFTALIESTNGSYCGIGVTISQNIDTGIITLVKPFEGSPGEEAGILPGDILYKVNGEEVTGEDLNEVVSKIKGEEGTTVDLTIAREGESDYIDLTAERREIEIPTISHSMIEGNIGKIVVTEFDEVTEQQFKDALLDLSSQGMEGLIVDLRNNPGGVLDVVVNMVDNILPEGIIVYTEDKYGNKDEYTSKSDRIVDVPMTVLVNGNSASASEIFAGAVQDYGVGKIVGTTTYGKGIVQRLFELGDGTALKLTISKYFTPNGNNIHGIGIKPDVEVELDEEVAKKITITDEEDNQLQKAIEVLKGDMSN